MVVEVKIPRTFRILSACANDLDDGEGGRGCSGMTATEPVIEYLRQLERQGKTHVHLDEQARLILREFYKRAAGISSQPAAPASPVQEAPTAPTASAASQPSPSVLREEPAPQARAIEPVTQLRVEGVTAAEKIAGLKAQAAAWKPAKDLGTLREKMVFSCGHPEAEIMFVGEAPGYHEEQKGEPFVGPAGQKLDGILKAMGLSRREVYISNIVKWRPKMQNQTTNNRKPSAEEMACSLGFVKAEISVVEPKVIIALGASAAEGLLGRKEPVANLREKFHAVEGVPVRVTYHPSYLLHNEQTEEKRKVWEDMLAVMDYLGMPINEKQRGFFLPKGQS
ncbi:DNA polymerase [Rubritalea squalenifaciens DSM 18772]|uniref:Type-4 uracil-DNA glycosylase n=2 Tax=Rubritalea squalenifaciens TaxID=407226 RepID=A0A1M6DCB4_9BACT|nr:DNA polymerase [Rubritalea squalenifaciens DSM 18772]